MGDTLRRLRHAVALALVAVVATGTAAACSEDEPAPGGKPTKLVIDTFGEFGYEDLVKTYEQQHGIKIELRKTGNLGDYRNKLVKYLATGKGAGDVVALEEGIINEFKLNPANWVDLNQYVPSGKSGEYLPWKWELGTAGPKLIGYPTDVGSLAVCYRRDLFKAAGLPEDREAVSKLWPDWNAFIETGRTYRAATGKGMLDSITSATNAVLFQGSGDLFYDKDDNLYNPAAAADKRTEQDLVAANSPTVKAAWDTAVKLLEANVSAKAQTWSPEWSAGFKQGTFAVTFCPSWMLGIVKGNSGEGNAGKWDVAAVPGGSGNWGGSWLAVPTQSKYPSEAAKLADFLTNASSQVAAFKKSGPLPTNKTALADPAFVNYQDPYFNNAPTAKTFGQSVANIQPIHLGPKHGAVKEKAFEAALNALQAGQLTADAAWAQFLKDVPIQGAF
ncbi:MAG TPA: extracellular solute-binding protein [Micromonosporaceae bacterium]